MVNLVNKAQLLEERPSDIEALGYEDEITHVKNRVQRLVSGGKHVIVAYLGPFGVGKSTILKDRKSVV